MEARQHTLNWTSDWFAEHGEYKWIELATAIRDALEKRGLVSHDLKLGGPPAYHGTNSRSRAERIRELGWKPAEVKDILASVEDDVEAVLRGE